jgi:hypothetical protein
MKLTRSEAMKLRHSVARVDKWLSLATPQDLADGLAWYDRARGMAEEMAAESGHICQWCGTHKENPLGMCSKCGRFPVRHCISIPDRVESS